MTPISNNNTTQNQTTTDRHLIKADGKNLFQVALQYLEQGFSIIPSGGGPSKKAPILDTWKEYQERLPTKDELEEWERKYHPHLWGIVTGKLSGVFVIDCDTEAAAQIFISAGLKPHVKTPRGGYHFYFLYPGFPIKTDEGILPGVDVRGDGGFVNLLGYRSDGKYEALND